MQGETPTGDSRQGDKRVFLTLDALRGVAAVMIVLFHSRALVGRFHPASAYLSVDLFFALSGCVLEASYRERLAAGLTTRGFMAIRFIRLWPLFALSLLIGAAFSVFRLQHGAPDESAWGIALELLTGMALLPMPSLVVTGWIMPLNPAGWSLVGELAINALYARCWRSLSDRLLYGVVGVAGVALAGFTLHHGGIDMGSTWASAVGGLVRVLYSFSLGVLMFRTYKGRVWRGWLSLLPPLLLIPLLSVLHGGHWYELAAALLLLPALVWVGLRVEPGPRLGRLFRWAGLTSYAIYALHGPVLKFVRLELVRHVGLDRQAIMIGGFVAIAALLPVCAALDRWYDAPLRRWMTRRLLRRPMASEAAMRPQPARRPIRIGPVHLGPIRLGKARAIL